MIEFRLRRIVQHLNDVDARYLVFGCLAAVAHGCMPHTDKIVLSLAFGAMNGKFGEIMRSADGLEVQMIKHAQSEFDAMYLQAERFDLSDGVTVSVCAYLDLVRSLRESGRSSDLVDLDSLEKVRRPRPAEYDPWYECTFEGSELWNLWRWSDLPFSEKIRSLEQSLELGRMFKKARK